MPNESVLLIQSCACAGDLVTSTSGLGAIIVSASVRSALKFRIFAIAGGYSDWRGFVPMNIFNYTLQLPQIS